MVESSDEALVLKLIFWRPMAEYLWDRKEIIKAVRGLAKEAETTAMIDALEGHLTAFTGERNEIMYWSINSADDDSALIVSNASKTPSSSPLLSSFATGLTSSRDSSSIVAKDTVSGDSDDEDVEYMGHFCSECSIHPPGPRPAPYPKN